MGVERDEIFTHYISLYADWCQIRAPDWIELEKKRKHPEKKESCLWIYFPLIAPSRQRNEIIIIKTISLYLVAGPTSIPSCEFSPRGAAFQN